MTYTYEVPVSYTINVSISATPSGLADFNTNSIAIFTNEAAGFSESYQAYLTPAGVKSDFGSDSLTYLMANALFTPVPNFRTGGGYLYIFPFNGTNAAAATLTTADISANIENIKAVTNGALNLTIDGVTTQAEGLDFSSISDIDDIVTVLNNKNLDVYIEAADDTIVFTSKQYGTSSGVSIEEASDIDDDAVDLYGSDYLDGANAAATDGANSDGTALSDAVSDALQQVYFGGVLTTQYCDNDTLQANAAAIQSLDCDYFETITSMKNIAILGAALQSAELSKTRTLALSNGAEDAKIAVAAYATIAKSVNWDGSNTANTMNLKTLTGCSSDNGLSDTYVLSAQTNGVDIYGNTGGLSVVYSNDNNGYTDDIEFQLAFKKSLEVTGFNYLRQTNTKIPQTEAGMTGLKNAYRGVCEKFVKNGAIAPNTWNSSVPFGDPEDFKRNIEETGYYIYSIPISEQSQSDREARQAPVVQIAVKTSGAIHFSDVIVNIER